MGGRGERERDRVGGRGGERERESGKVRDRELVNIM